MRDKFFRFKTKVFVSSLVFVFVLVFVLVSVISCAQPKPRKPISTKPSSFIEKSISYNKAINKREEEIIKEYIRKDSLTDYIVSPNGFWYSYIKKNEGKDQWKPQFGDQVFYTYEVYNIDNQIIYSQLEVGEKEYYIDQQNIVEGLRNGLKLMCEGEIVTFLFPSHKIYGYLGDNKKIGNNQSLIYKVKLNKIVKNDESN